MIWKDIAFLGYGFVQFDNIFSKQSHKKKKEKTCSFILLLFLTSTLGTLILPLVEKSRFSSSAVQKQITQTKKFFIKEFMCVNHAFLRQKKKNVLPCLPPAPP